jgi:hypothetical protein
VAPTVPEALRVPRWTDPSKHAAGKPSDRERARVSNRRSPQRKAPRITGEFDGFSIASFNARGELAEATSCRNLNVRLVLNGDDRDRTGNLLVANQALSQLSCVPFWESRADQPQGHDVNDILQQRSCRGPQPEPARRPLITPIAREGPFTARSFASEGAGVPDSSPTSPRRSERSRYQPEAPAKDRVRRRDSTAAVVGAHFHPGVLARS